MEEKEIRQYAEIFIEHYFYKKNLSVLMSMMHPDICWSHYGQRIVRGIDNVKKMLDTKEALFSLDFCHVQFLDMQISDQSSSVEYKVELQVCQGDMRRTIVVFGNLTFILDNQDILLYEVTFSLFRSLEQMSEYALEKIPYENETYFQQIHTDLEVLTNNVPGGIFKCLDNDELTILYMSEGFLSMVGYTRDEIQERFHNSFKEMIAPEDRFSISQEVKRQMNLGKTKRIEYRIIHHDGHYVWVLDKGKLIEEDEGRLCFYCIIIDVTQEKKVEEELRLSLERYNIIIDQTNDVIFEWDILKKQIRFSKNWKNIFNDQVLEVEKSSFENDEFKKYFYPQDACKLDHILNEINHGKHYIEEEMRLIDKDRQCHWCRLRLTVQFDEHEVPISIIGILVDIDEEKRRSQYLLHKAQQDALTGIYNKMTVQSLIKDYLLEMNTHEMCALMIIDIDNFKEINDFQGHLFGDAILSDIARRMKNVFPYTDIIGRIGGDEFAIFFKNIHDLDDVKKKAQAMIHETYLLEESHKHQLHISCSIGISIAPRDGMEFTELFQKADRALYQAKNEGKKQFVIYDQSIMHEYLMNNSKQYSLVSEKIDSNDNNRISGGQIAEYVFRVLYNSSDVKNAVSSILEIVGLQFDVSRVYIFENVDHDQYCCNTFEWCNQGVEPQMDVLSHVSYDRDLGGNYIDNFDENGIFYCSDIKSLPKLQYEILAPQGIKSMLQCAIKSNGIFKGYVGFDECRQNRYWTQEQIDVLVFISEILSVFLLKSRAETNLKQESRSLLSVLNNQRHSIYVIDPQTFQILFMNKKTRELCQKEKNEKPCYEIFMKRQSPCDFCPAIRLNSECEHYKQEVYNPYFQCRLDIDASHVLWEGQEAIMLSCYNISQYQK